MNPPPLQPGDLVAGRYLLLSSLGEGGMALVFEALDQDFQRRVALKILRRASEVMVARFEREARAASGLHHPAVVKVFDFGSLANGRPYLALEMIEGEDLYEVLQREGKLAPDRCLQLLLPVVGALAEAHAAGIVHRDLKPSNLMVQKAPGQPETTRLLDFGIAAMEEKGGGRITRTGEVFGTPEFMAPEQAMSHPVSPATDVWALGGVMYELMTGEAPFSGASPHAVLYQVVNTPPPPMPPWVPAEVIDLVMACLKKDPAERPADASELLERIEALLLPARRELVSSRPAGMPVPLRPSGGWMAGTPPPSLSAVRAPALRSSSPPRPMEAPSAPPASVPPRPVTEPPPEPPEPTSGPGTLPPPPRGSVWPLVAVLIVVGAGLGIWWLMQPRAGTPTIAAAGTSRPAPPTAPHGPAPPTAVPRWPRSTPRPRGPTPRPERGGRASACRRRRASACRRRRAPSLGRRWRAPRPTLARLPRPTPPRRTRPTPPPTPPRRPGGRRCPPRPPTPSCRRRSRTRPSRRPGPWSPAAPSARRCPGSAATPGPAPPPTACAWSSSPASVATTWAAPPRWSTACWTRAMASWTPAPSAACSAPCRGSASGARWPTSWPTSASSPSCVAASSP
ncbi:MAG: serine/threonine protein kinase [Myxococcales bacterium]|nr:serine/threonine protein kinase [Myxococcales bacterium]